MSGAADLASEVEAFSKIVDNLVAVAARSDPARRSELVGLRRQLSERIAQMRDTGLLTFADPELANDFRSRLSRVLNLMAMHQAKWPAVSIDEAEDDYRRSALQLADANRNFIAWTRAALARIG